MKLIHRILLILFVVVIKMATATVVVLHNDISGFGVWLIYGFFMLLTVTVSGFIIHFLIQYKEHYHEAT